MLRKTVLSLILMLAAIMPASAQANTRNISAEKVTVKAIEKPLWEIMAQLTIKNNIPVGLEESALDKDHNNYYFVPNIPYIPPIGTYVTSGVPVVDKLKKNSRIHRIRHELLKLPEVVAFLKTNGLHSSDIHQEFNFTTRKLPDEMNFSDLTLRELLNNITTVKKGGWILKMSDVVGSKEIEYIDFII